MNFKTKLTEKLLNESIESRINDITKQLSEKNEIEEVDNFDLEVGQEYEYKKSDDSPSKKLKFLKRGKKSSHGPFYFTDEKGNEIMLGQTQVKKMKKNLAEMIHSELEEKLYGGQKKLDKNHNNKIDAEDFKMLRKGKKSEMEEDLGGMEDSHPDFGDINLSKLSDEDKKGKFAKYYNPLSLKDKKKNDDIQKESINPENVIYDVTFGNESVSLTEDEMVNLIEELVNEQKSSTPGIAKYQKISREEKSQNEKALKDVSKKMKDYVKAGSKAEYNENPEYFPKGNGELAKMDKKAYIPSKDVDEYVDAFAYPGMTNLVFDEIKPDDEKIEKYLKGDATTGNSSEYANAVKTDVGDKFYKNYEENLYGAEQMKASYKRQNQPVDIAGEVTPKSGKKSGKKSSSIDKASKILNNLDETVQTETDKLLSEEMLKMKKLISY
jgi:hypothetical protein